MRCNVTKESRIGVCVQGHFEQFLPGPTGLSDLEVKMDVNSCSHRALVMRENIHRSMRRSLEIRAIPEGRARQILLATS